jgi:MerR family transcriptional regulator, repressor of the yfmOP operon
MSQEKAMAWERKQVRTGEAGKELYLINEVSRMVNLSQKRIREYEKGGFFKPLREKNTNNRLYSPFDIAQIEQITKLIHERGFTLTCLKNLLVHAPCWNIFDCKAREACPAFQLPWRPCYEVRKETPGKRSCSQCPIFLNRDFRKERILEKFPSGG